MQELNKHVNDVNSLLARYGVRFGIYKNNTFKEQLFPFDTIARVIKNEEFTYLDKGLSQRVTALNMFLADIYGEKNILKDKVIPEDFVYSSSGYTPECEGIQPPKSVYSHISGIDLVQGKDQNWYVLEDNLRIPSGASYPMIARSLCRKASPATFKSNHIYDNRNYAEMLKTTMDYVNTGGINVILTPGRFNAAYFEHSYLAEQTNSILATGNDLVVEGDYLYYVEYGGTKEKVGAVYRRISDEYLDPMTFCEESLIGVPHIFDVYRKRNVALINAPGNGVADDKGIYYFVPKIIKYYLGEEAILHNAPTYLPFYEDDMKYVMENLSKLVIKDVAEAGGYGVVFGDSLTQEELEDFRQAIIAEPRRFIAQEVVDFLDLDVLDENGAVVQRKADYGNSDNQHIFHEYWETVLADR